MRRWLCLCLALTCLFGMVGCGSPAASTTPPADSPAGDLPHESPRVLAIAYNHDDTLNPYVTSTEANLMLAGLLYDSLTVIDGAFTPQLSLAASVTATDATHLSVALRADAVFSDGSAVTAADVLASFTAARKSANYDDLLANISAAALDRQSGAIIFTLTTSDPHAAACLSFPVYKASTATTAAAQAPLGGGAYVYTVDDNGAFLTANPHHTDTPHYTTVPLRHLPNAQSMYYGLASGNITYYYNDLNTGDIPRVTGASIKVNMNDLLYLGLNSNHPLLSQPTVRQAFSLLLNRQTLATSGCAGWAVPATTPFHPAWAATTDIPSLFGEQDLAGALDLLGNTIPKKTTLKLIYSLDSGNRSGLADMLRTQLESAGVSVTVTPLAYADYIAQLQSGDYDLYIGEIRLSANMDLSPLLDGGDARYGVATDDPATLAYRSYRAGDQSLADFIKAFGESMPYIPIAWRCGFAAYDRRLQSVTPHGYAPYYGLPSWH